MERDFFLVVDKPAGMTSQRVVARLKRRLKCYRLGHTGTLDPLATGVLPLAANRATKLIPFLDEGRKLYSGEIELGVESDTLDRDGEITARRPLPEQLTASSIAALFERYVGEIEQTPPLYSALKRNGKPLYAYARAGRGDEIEIPKRRVTIFSFELLAWHPPRIAFRVACSRGTYVRSLAAEIGRELGCGARLWSLCREASGPFFLNAALSLEEIEERLAAVGEGKHELPFISPLEALSHLPRYELTVAELAAAVAHGRSLSDRELTAAGVRIPASDVGGLLLLVGDKRLLAVARREAESLKMVRVLV